LKSFVTLQKLAMQVDNMIDTLEELKLDRIEDAIEDIRNGKIIIVVDDEDRENEGDFICAAEHVTPEIINFMATHGRGLICTPITEERAKELKLNPMVDQNTDLHGTAFTVSIDYKNDGCTTGISAYDRATGIKAIINENTKAEDYARPGHIFPLIAQDGGVLRRTGHTEAAIDLTRMAGLAPAGVLVEILNEDGTMARLPQLLEFAKIHDFKIISIKDLVAYRMSQERLVNEIYRAEVKTQYGPFELIAFKEETTNFTHVAMKKGSWDADESVLTRVYSSGTMEMILRAMINEEEPTIHRAMRKIEEEGKGVLVLIRQSEQEEDFVHHLKYLVDSSDAEAKAKHQVHQLTNRQRNVGIGAQILREIGLRKLRILTNNPRPVVALTGYGLEIEDHVPF